MVKKVLLSLIVLFGVFFCTQNIYAGFGISPPYVKTSKPIFPGSHYEQRINLLRSSADKEMQAIVKVNAPEISSWISIDKGETFNLPINELKTPMVVRVDVPKNAEIGNYKGHINIKIVPKDAAGGVAIALGARVDIELDVTDETFIEFKIRTVDIPDIELLGKPWNWKIFSRFFYRIKVLMKIENTGNTKIAPSKVQLDVYNITEKELLESHIDRSIKKIEPFSTDSVFASFPTKLKPGEYWGKISIYKGNEIVQKNKINFNVLKHGKLPGGTKLGIWPWLMMGGMILLTIIFIIVLIKVRIWNLFYKLLMIIIWPLRKIWYLIVSIFAKIKKSFWQWMHKKASEHQAKQKDEE